MEPKKVGWGWRALHWAIILNLLFEVLYAGYMVFFVIVPKGISGPLGSAALQIKPHIMYTRRLYAIEFWIAFAGLALYLALTEMIPRFWSFSVSSSSQESSK
ncbi:MAG: hypothetical protein EP343_11360 [Deltaproteobacteria bacterium]|nr:MAG: hypothetical protein EP343_11360 [Deltaproteobacteria bacterium]